MGLQILGQLKPSASSAAALFVSSGQCVCSSLVCCNKGASADQIRVWVVPAGETAGDKNLQFYNVDVPAYTTFTATLGITLSEGDFVVVYGKLGTMSFSAYGQYL